MTVFLEEVFGVSAKPVLSYVERTQVDDSFKEALESGKQVIVYGSSKQGKTALVSKHLPYSSHILVSLTPKFTLLDIYQQILASVGVRIIAGTTDRSSTEQSASITARVKALLPLFGGGEAEASGKTTAGSGTETRFEEVPVNLELPQTVADLLNRISCKKWVILENFHYLTDAVQKEFAFDLRAFQELGLRFVILGVWRERNRMAQFNGDLLDRTIEIPVEPWHESDFRRVVKIGEEALSVKFSDTQVEGAIGASFSSIGVFQELLKNICIEEGVRERQVFVQSLSDPDALKAAIETKTHDYASRHQRALEAIAAGHASSGGPKNDRVPLFLPYYLVRTILEHGFDGVRNGVKRPVIHDWIRSRHHRGDDVRASDMTNLLDGLANLQSVKSISPPIFAYDSQQKLLQVVDSTFYFFIKNADRDDAIAQIQNPLDTFTASMDSGQQ